MPYLHLRTNVDIEDEQDLLQKCSSTLARELGKPERYVMVSLAQGVPLRFAGTAEPAAYVELKSLGLTTASTAPLSAAICRLLAEELGIDQARVYIEFASPERAMFGWNGGTF